MITPKSRRIDHMVVGDFMYDVERWVEERLGWTKMSQDGKQITIHDSQRPPYTYGEARNDSNWATARKGFYILHNGYGQFRILTKAQFDYWYEEKE